MSAISDALRAVRNVLLMQERLEAVRQDLRDLAANVDGLKDYVVSIDKRLLVVETLIRVSAGRHGEPPLLGGGD